MSEENNLTLSNYGSIALSIFGIFVSVISLYLSEKHPILLLFALIIGFFTISFLAFHIGKTPGGKNLLGWSILTALILLICGFFYYVLIVKVSNQATLEIPPDEAKQIIDDFHNAINDKNCDRAFSMLTERFKTVNKVNLTKFTTGCKNTVNLHINDIPAAINDVKYFDAPVQWKQGNESKMQETVWGLKRDLNGKLKIDAKLKKMDD